jgi:hypothetical protein
MFKQANRKFATLLVLSVSAIVFMGPALSKSKHVFMMATMVDKGVLKHYLDDKCTIKSYKICAYKDALPAKLDDFLWNDNSPLYKIGSWKGTKDEFNEILHNIFATPAYLKQFMTRTLEMTFTQTITFHIGDGNQVFETGSNVNGRIVEYFPHEVTAFNASRENSNDLSGAFTIANALFSVVICLSMLVLFAAVFMWRALGTEIRTLLVVAIVGTVANCVYCAAFSAPLGRYGAKCIWLLPLCAIGCIIHWTTRHTKQAKLTVLS